METGSEIDQRRERGHGRRRPELHFFSGVRKWAILDVLPQEPKIGRRMAVESAIPG